MDQALHLRHEESTAARRRWIVRALGPTSLPTDIVRTIALMAEPARMWEQVLPGQTISLRYMGGSTPGTRRELCVEGFVMLRNAGMGLVAEHRGIRKSYALGLVHTDDQTTQVEPGREMALFRDRSFLLR